MELSRNRIGKAGAVFGAGGAILLACSACCLPLAASVLAWLGLAGVSLMGPVGMGAAAIGAAALVWMALARRRRLSRCQAQPMACTMSPTHSDDRADCACR